MKNKFLFYISVWLLFFAFFVFSPKLYAHLVESEGKPIESNISFPDINKNNKHNLDSLSVYDERDTIYVLSGWAFSTESYSKPTDIYTTYLFLFSENNNYLFETYPEVRGDVIYAFSESNYDIRFPGFSAHINKNILPSAKYCIGIIFKNNEDNSTSLINTRRVVDRTPNNFFLREAGNDMCNKLLINYVNN